MVANESEALIWVARQWERRIETDVILNVYGMLREWYKSGHEEGGCFRQSEQQCERHGSQMISWIVLRTKR